MEYTGVKLNSKVITVENTYRFNNCPFCNSAAIKKIGDLFYYGQVEFSSHVIETKYIPEIWSCNNCHSKFTQNSIKPEQVKMLYETGEGSKRWTLKTFVEDKTKRMVQCIDKYLTEKNIKLLDFGCNDGSFLDYAKKYSLKTYGIELCIESREKTNSKGHIAFESIEETNEKFDLITAFDVFEHLYRPIDFLSSIYSSLNENGLLIILTGNPCTLLAKLSKNKWWYFNYPEHVVFPAPSFFSTIKGFKVIERVNVFASTLHDETGFIFGMKNFIKIIIGKNYSGRPAIVPDHQLVVLQKE